MFYAWGPFNSAQILQQTFFIFQIYHVDYLRLIKLYGVQDVKVPNLSKSKEEKEEDKKTEALPQRYVNSWSQSA